MHHAIEAVTIGMDHELVCASIAAGRWEAALNTLSNEHRPDLIEHMLGLGMSGTPELRRVVQACWESDHDVLRQRFGGRRLIELFRAQRYPHPFREPVRVYRGERLAAVAPSPRSWTLEPGLAAWFAVLYRGGLPDPIVVTGIVRPGDVLLATNDRSEAEVVPARVYERRIFEAEAGALMRRALIWQRERPAA